MQNAIKRKKIRSAIVCAAVVIAIMAAYLSVFIFAMAEAAYGELIAVGILAVYALLILAVIVGVVLALRQRLKEIEGGEEEDAKQY